MDRETRNALNAINRRFYEITAREFDRTRGAAWPGWTRLLSHLHTPTDEPLTVLDVGCGNGRFGLFLAESVSRPVQYHGVDNNAGLLDFARNALADAPTVTARLDLQDVVEMPPDSGQYDLMVAFGLLHHIPGADFRRAFVRSLADRVAPSGLLVLAYWRFYEFDRFRDRIAPWPDDLKQKIEPGDYLLDWRRGEHALRYCHYVDDAERDVLVEASALNLVDTYRADGFTGTVNAYTILRRGG